MYVLLYENKTWCATEISTWSIFVFIIYKLPSFEHSWSKFDYVCRDINVLIIDIDVGALQNKADQVIIDLESWF